MLIIKFQIDINNPIKLNVPKMLHIIDKRFLLLYNTTTNVINIIDVIKNAISKIKFIYSPHPKNSKCVFL